MKHSTTTAAKINAPEAASVVREHLDEFADFLKQFSSSVGHEYETDFHRRLCEIDVLASECSKTELADLRKYCLALTETEFGQSTIIHHGRRKPYGYSGDFQIIDWTYTQFIGSRSARGKAWDEFYHRQVAPRAVRDRKDQFGLELTRVAARSSSRPIRVLNIGSGPARELLDGSKAAGLTPADLQVVCVDIDKNAISYARDLLGPSWEGFCSFEQKNAIRFRPKGQFDLVWSSGLFDYLEARVAAILLRTMYDATATGGQITIGNFADTHSTRPWIEWCGAWFLIHRTQDAMQTIADQAGIVGDQTTIRHNIDKLHAVRYMTIHKL